MQTATEPKDKERIEATIMKLMSSVSSVEDMLELDDAVQDLLF